MLVNEILFPLRCYAAYVGSYLPTFRDNLYGFIGTEMSVANYKSTARKIPEQRESHLSD